MPGRHGGDAEAPDVRRGLRDAVDPGGGVSVRDDLRLEQRPVRRSGQQEGVDRLLPQPAHAPDFQAAVIVSSDCNTGVGLTAGS